MSRSIPIPGMVRVRLRAADVTPDMVEQWRREGRRPAKKSNGDVTVLFRENELERVEMPS